MLDCDCLELDGRRLDAKPAVAKGSEHLHSKKPEDRKKLFIGQVPDEMTQSDFEKYFSQFGQISDCVVMIDTKTNKSRGFGFVTYGK